MSPDDAYECSCRELAVIVAEAQSGNATQDVESPFYGYPHDDYLQALRELREEVEERAYLAIIAATEGVLQTDFRARKRAKAKVPLRNTAKVLIGREERGRRRVELEEILDAWAEEPDVPNGVIGEFKQLMAHRHWLAHGRYFVDRSGILPGIDFAMNRVTGLLSRLHNVDPDFPRS